MQKTTRHVLVLVTCGSRPEAARIANAVVEGRLAACVNIFESKVSSVYRWKDRVEQAREILLTIKTTRMRLAALQTEIMRLHSYDTPEFIVVPIQFGSAAYLAWIDECVGVERASSRGKSRN